MCITNNMHTIKNEKLEKRLKMLNNFHSKVDDSASDQLGDVLSKTTYLTKIVFKQIDDYWIQFLNSKYICVVTKTTQPAHLLTILAVMLTIHLWQPHSEIKTPMFKDLTKFTYLGAFCVYLGSQMWMTFVSGLSLYFSLPRHHFGNVQRVLFPKYFSLNTFLTLAILLSYSKLNKASLEQIAPLTVTFLSNLLIRLYLTPPLLRFMTAKNRMEAAAGLGTEIGSADVGVLKNCPVYMKLYKSFRKVHMIIACGNILSMACSIVHLHYLSSKLCF